MTSFTIGVDVGGTCTDSVVVDDDGGMVVGKAFSTPDDFSQGIVASLGAAGEHLELSVGELLEATPLFLHSTTVAENAIVGGGLRKAGLLATRGFEDTLYMSRGGYGRYAGLTEEAVKNIVDSDKPTPLVPTQMIEGIKERTDVFGEILDRPDAEEIESAAQRLVERGAEALGVCFLGSFVNGENERAARAVIEKAHPKLFLTCSSELVPIEGEYERMSTVALNASLGPIIAGYLSRLLERLKDHRFAGSLLVMQAHGGLLPVGDAPGRAVGMIESGPVGGLVGSQRIGSRLGHQNILAADMGGTTFKAGLIRAGRMDYEREPTAVRYHYSLPKLDMASIALAGGSVISLDPRTELPKVGPRSAGSFPGPVCYGFGGREPTITDVDLLLGFLDPRFFLGGTAKLDPDAARDAFAEQIADRLGMSVTEAAGGVYDLANSIIYNLLHKQTVQRGVDCRDYALFVSGGTAAMHLGAVAPELGVSRIVIPHSASVHGAFGVVNADIVYGDILSRQLPMPANPATVNEIFRTVVEGVTQRLVAAGFSEREIQIERAVNMRYRRQVHVLTVPVPGENELSEGDLDAIADRFHEIYAERYGPEAGYREAGIEMVSFLVRGVTRLKRPDLRSEAERADEPAVVEERDAYFGSMMNTRCYLFDAMSPGHTVSGPAVIWTPITTIVVQPQHTARVDEYRNVIITW